MAANIAPDCTTTVKNSLISVIPISFWAIIRCPVDDMGRNSVRPSIVPRIMLWIRLIDMYLIKIGMGDYVKIYFFKNLLSTIQ